MASNVRFKVLGPVGVDADGTPLAIGAPRQRALLALLLLDANRAIRPHALIEGIWGESIPQHPDAALQIVVSRLRSSLGPVAERLSSGPAGYRIEVAEDELDHLRARALFQHAQDRRERDDVQGAAAAADAALACWTADALDDLSEAPFYDSAYRDLRELRLAIYEFRNRAYLDSGRHVEVLADIDTWIRYEPWRERIRAQHMVALYRTGRRVDALAEYEALRRSLADELDVEPSHFVQELYGRMLDQDPTLLARRSGIVATLPTWTPCGLPFVGRSREEQLIFDALRDVAAGATRMVLVEGEAGIGKSRLVLETARRADDDAIILAVDGADALHPGLLMLTAALTEASVQLSDAELALCLGRWPGDVADIAPALRRRLPDLPPPLEADAETRAARVRAAIVSWISALSQRAPVMLLLDDIHRAGTALLLLLDALFVDDEPKRILVLATARSGGADRSSRLEQLARSVQKRGALDRIELEGLGSDQVERLLNELALPDASNLAAQLTLTTHGHPYLLGEMLREPDRGTSATRPDDISLRIRQFVLRRVAGLGEPAAHLLNIASATHSDFDLALLAEVSRGTARSTELLVDQAINGGFLHVTGLGSFDFVHDLARRAILESIDADTRAALHRDIAIVLERHEANSSAVAAQWSLARGADADEKTCIWAERAGDSALVDLDPYTAAEWFALAAARATDERSRAHLLIRLAGAQCRAGDATGAETLRAALEVARRLDDRGLIIEAATLWTPIWTSMPTLSPRERIELLSEGARRADDLGVRALLRARLATELTLTPEWERARVLADEAISDVRVSGSREALPEVFMRHFQVTCTPHNLAERRRNIEEAVAASAGSSDPVQRFFALSTAASAAIESADVETAWNYLDTAFALGTELGVAVLAFNMECIRVWRRGLEGDLVEAERLALSAAAMGSRQGIGSAVVGPALQIACVRWQQGRFAELLPMVQGMRVEGDLSSEILLARALACFVETNHDAFGRLEQAAARDFENLPLGLHWAPTLVAAAEAAFMVGNARVGEVVLSHLRAFPDQVAFNGSWAIAPLAFGAGMAAAAAGQDAATDEMFEHALAVSDRLRAPLLRARTEIAWSRVLLARDAYPERALTLARDARDRLVGLRVKPILGSADALLREAEAALAGQL